MIVRSYFKCLTCGQVHTVRIGMGQEDEQKHHIQCVNCGEDMVVGMVNDYQNIANHVHAFENAEIAEEDPEAPIINVDANFPIPADQRHADMAFPRLEMMERIIDAAEARGIDLEDPAVLEKIARQPHTRPNFEGQWKLLKKAWSLHRNKKDKLSEKRVKEASKDYYSSEPLSNLDDWVFRFVQILAHPMMTELFDDAVAELKLVKDTDQFQALIHFYDKEMREERSYKYFSLMRDFFAAYAEFGQAIYLVQAGVDLPEDHIATSNDFKAVKMFYGTAYETFSYLVDVLAYLNNIKMGRDFDTFEQLDQEAYLKLDKPGRFNPFSTNQTFAAMCNEKDNQLRNASHHEQMVFNSETQEITYKTGKGGQGAQQTITYAEYLTRCLKLFLQTMLLFRVEILMCQGANIKKPI